MEIGTLYAELEIPQQHSASPVSREEGEFLYQLLKQHSLYRTIETGFAIGVSAAYILSATGTAHYAIDPNPGGYDHMGLKNLRTLGLDHLLQLQIEPSHSALPRLYREGVQVDFGFIDGDHRFDGIFVDFYYLDLMLVPGGFVVFHDMWMGSSIRVVNWICTNKKNYVRIAGPSNLAILQKIGADSRDWDHFVEFGPPPSKPDWWRRPRRWIGG